MLRIFCSVLFFLVTFGLVIDAYYERKTGTIHFKEWWDGDGELQCVMDFQVTFCYDSVIILYLKL